ncbi:galactoside alpha-(1,2)-fucosyltransferase 2-like [Saccostrea cucullata]|uniref:galactoside alpha-(1,2)-fucosyltransferase 2-like n=1 Tax=Saccostrea cuccullata TaxID=36930 RepID=UPI002ECFCD22
MNFDRDEDIMKTFNLKNSIFQFLNRRGKTLLKVFAVVVLIYFFYWEVHCMIFKQNNVVCIYIQGRLANAMFQEAFVYSFAKERDGTEVVFGSENPLVNIFTLEGLNWKYDRSYSCSCYSKFEDKWDCAFDDVFERLMPPVQVYGYFQSWKYLKGHEEGIRRMFTFQPHIQNKAKDQLHTIVDSFKDKGVSDKTVLVGIHIRRGDYIKKKHFVDFGYNVAPDVYIHNAIKFYQVRYPDVLFIVCGNDIAWAREVMKSYGRVHFVEGNSPSQDMALLTRTHHTIMTVGTFGWWIGWLTNGTTVYYKHTYREGTDFMAQFHGSTQEHFLPNWIGLE